VLVTVLLAGCGSKASPAAPSTPPSVDAILAHRVIWVAHAPSHYSYQWTSACSFCGLNGVPIQLEVRADTVRTATFAQTGKPVPGSYVFFPSVDALFDLALVRLGERRLVAIVFDPQWGYPARMDFTGADISGSLSATELESLP
jgi:hypothetical protein